MSSIFQVLTGIAAAIAALVIVIIVILSILTDLPAGYIFAVPIAGGVYLLVGVLGWVFSTFTRSSPVRVQPQISRGELYTLISIVFGASLVLYGLAFQTINSTNTRIDGLGSSLNGRIDNVIDKIDGVEDRMRDLENRMPSR